ncbi:MAG: GDP-mannose 4,6-dehydratase [Dehalococcoidia bacterium]
MPLHGPALVTGAAGFIGGTLVHRLVAEGIEVTGFDRHPPARPLPEAARHIEGDIRDPASVRAAIEAARPEVVYHLAAQTSVSISMREPRLDIESNILGTLNVAEACIEGGVRRLVAYSSGGAIFGEPASLPVADDDPKSPQSVYGVSKLAGDLLLPLLVEGSDLEVSVVRPGNVYGPWQDPHGEAGVIAIFAMRMLANQDATIYGDGSQFRDYVFVDDVVEATVRAATRTPAACIVATGTGTSTREIFEAVARAVGYERPPVMAPERPGDIHGIALDASRAREAWGWAPETSFEDGVQRTVEWFRTRPA